MATSCATLTQRTRRFLRDWPESDSLTASCTSGSTTLTVADATIYSANWMIELESEVMRVVSGVGTTLTVRRGQYGTTGASHANSTVILVKPAFYSIEILDALNAGLNAAFPYLHSKIVDESLTTAADDYEYTIPDMPGVSGYKLPYISEVWLRDAGGTYFYRTRGYNIRRDDTAPFIQFKGSPAGGATIRIVGYGPYAALTTATSLPADFPPNAEDLLVWFSANYLLASGEAARVRQDVGTIDAREQANRTGSSMQAANTLFQRFQLRLRDAAMPPLPPHVVSTF